MYPNTKFNRTFLGDFFYVPPKDATSPAEPQPKGDLRRSKYEVQVLPAGPPQDAPFRQQLDFRKLRPSYEKELAIRTSLHKFGRQFTGDPGYKRRGVQPAKTSTELPEVPKKPPSPQKPKRKTSYPSLDFKTLPELYKENLRRKEQQRQQQEKEERQKRRMEKKKEGADDVIRLPQLAHAALQKMHDVNKQRRSVPGLDTGSRQGDVRHGSRQGDVRHEGAWRPPAQVYTPPWPHHIPYKDGDPLIPFEAMYPTPEFVKKERREKARTHVPYPHHQSWRPPADVRTPPWPHKVHEDKRITCPREFQHYVQYHMMPGLYSADSGQRPKVRKVRPKKVRVERPDIWSYDSQRFVYRSVHPALQI